MTVSEKLLIKMDANTIDAVRKMAKVADSMKKIGNEAEKSKDRVTLSLNKITAGIVGINQGLELAQKAIQGLHKAFELANFRNEVARLGQIVDQGLVQRIQGAVGNTIDQFSIMKETAKAMQGPFGLLEEQITDVWMAADNLGKKGFGESTKLAEQMFRAFSSGEIESLKPLGFAFAEGTDKATKFEEALKQVHGIAADGAPFDAQAEAIDRTSAALTDFANEQKFIWGEVASFVIKVMGEIANAANELSDQMSDQALSGGANVHRKKSLWFFQSTHGMKRGQELYNQYIGQNLSKQAGFDHTNPFSQKNFSMVADNVNARNKAEEERNSQLKAQKNKVRALMSRDAPVLAKIAAEYGISAIEAAAIVSGQVSLSNVSIAGDVISRYNQLSKKGGAKSGGGYKLEFAEAGTVFNRKYVGLGQFGADGGALGAGVTGPGSSFGAQLGAMQGSVSDPMGGLKNIFGPGQSAGMREFSAATGEASALLQESFISATAAAIMGEKSMVDAFRAAAASRLQTLAIEWYARAAGMMWMNPAAGIGLAAAASGALVAARKLGGGKAAGGAVRPSLPAGGGFRPSQSGGGGGPGGSTVVINVYGGQSSTNAVAIDNAIKQAKNAGLIPSGSGPSRLVA